MIREKIIAAARAGKSLARANLRGANLRVVSLRGASFRRANLQEASFQRADLRKADFRRANLYGANFYEADLRGANFQEANLFFMYAYEAKTAGIKLSWVPKKGDLVRTYPDFPYADKGALGILLEDPDPDRIFNLVSVRLHDREIKFGITHMKPASRLEEIIQEELKKELKR
jgi:hypothetical protein